MLRVVECETSFTQQTSCRDGVVAEIKTEKVGLTTQAHLQYLQKEVQNRDEVIAGIEHAIQILQSQLRSKKSIDSSR